MCADVSTKVIDEPMTVLEYPSEAFAPKLSASRAASAKEESHDVDSPSKLQISEQTQPAVGLTIKLPSDVMFFEEPQVAKWDETGVIQPANAGSTVKNRALPM